MPKLFQRLRISIGHVETYGAVALENDSDKE